MAKTEDPWHFPRTALARATLDLLLRGPAQALTLFGPRRTGKTEFLLRDLGPAAEAEGLAVVYASFWQTPLAPLAVLLQALDSARRDGSFRHRVRSLVAGLRPRIRMTVPGGAGAEIDLSALGGSPAPDLLLELDQRLDALAPPGRLALLLLDEVQEIARDPANRPLVAALRTSLDRRPDRLRAVFTGSSREGLRAMFSAREAPFFHFATPIDLPPLEDGFVDHLARAFAAATGRQPDRPALLAAFRALHRSPYFFRRLLEAMMQRPDHGVAEALAALRERIAEDLGYPRIWLALTPIQRATARLLAEGTEKPFGRAARERAGALLGAPVPTVGQIRAALRKLARDGLADQPAGRWALDDPEFAAWILGRDAPGGG